MPFIVYSASAGSGKTYTLVNEYLSMTLPDPRRFPQVLAITFTNRAAAQMKERIVDALAEMRQGRDPERLQTLSKMTGLPREELIRQSGQLLTALLHQYGDYAVMTIDSFILRVVRAFSFDLGLPLRFEVELSQERVTSLLVERVIAQARAGHRIGDILTRFILEKIYYQQNWNYEEEILGIARQRFSDRSLSPINELLEIPDSTLDGLESRFSAWLASFEQTVHHLCFDIIDGAAARNLNVDDFHYKKTSVFSQIVKMSRARKKNDYEIGSRLRNDPWFSKKDTVSEQKRTFEEQFEPHRQSLVHYIDTNLPRFSALWDIRRSLPTLRMLKEFELELEKLGRNDRLVPISQFNRKVAGIIEDEGIPYIYLRIGEHFRHYLIDEFQDTNRLQWNNLFPLIENALAEGNRSLVVGDPKQSIYRWRGGDPSIMEDDIPASFPPGTLEYHRLESNFRSLSTVVEFNNRFFSGFSAEPDLPPIHRFSVTQVSQHTAVRSDLPGYVEIRFFSEDSAVQWTVNHIRNAHDNGLDYRDMAVLIRKKKDAAPIAEALISENIPVITSDSLLLSQYQVVRAVIAVLSYLQSRDVIHLMEILAYFLGDEYPEFLTTLPDCDRMLKEVKTRLPLIDHWLNFPAALSLYDLTEEICAAFTSSAPLVPLLSLLDLIFVQSPRMNGDLGTFLEWWRENKDNDSTLITNCQSPDSVQILTIHKAKGLEFPLVIMPFADWNIVNPGKSRDPELWVYDLENRLGEGPLPYLIPISKPDTHLFGREIEAENLSTRIDALHELYVSFTRAKSYLFVGARSSTPKQVSGWIRSRLETLWPERKENESFVYGELKFIRNVVPETPPDHPFRSQPFNSWQNRLSVRSDAIEDWLDRSDPRTEGKLLHRLLSRIYREEDLTAALTWAVESGLIGEDQSRSLRRRIEDLFELRLFGDTVGSHFRFPWQVRTEATIMSGLQSSRPDRIQFSGNRIRIIDYKREVPHASHVPQIQSYIDRLRRAYPGHEVRGALIYILSGIIVEADPDRTVPEGEA